MSVVLDVQPDTGYEPSEAEMIEYGKWLGMELPEDSALLWIAREGLKAPLPDNWKACKSEKGELYYFNFKTGQSIWDHPSDEHYRELLRSEKSKLKAKGSDKEDAEQTAATPTSAGCSSKLAKQKKAKSGDTKGSGNTAKAQEETTKDDAISPPVQPAALAPIAPLKKQPVVPAKLASLHTDVTKSEKAANGRIVSPEFPSTTSQSDSSLVSEPPKTLKVDQPQSIPLPSEVVAGGGVHGLRALDKLSSVSPTAASASSTTKAAVAFAKEQKEKADQQAAKELEAYKSEQQKKLRTKADAEVEAALGKYRKEEREKLRAKIDGDIATELAAYRAEQEAALRRQKEELDTKTAEEARKYQDTARAEVERRRGEDEREIADAVSSETHKLDQDIEKKLTELRHAYEKKRAEEAERLRQRYIAQLDHDKRKVEAEVAHMLETFTREKRQESEIKKEAQSQALREASESVSDVKQISASFLRQYEGAFSGFMEAIQSSYNVLVEQGVQRQRHLQSDLEAKLTEVSKDHEQRLQQEKDQMHLQLESLRQHHATAVEALKGGQREELQKLKDNFNEQRSQAQRDQVSKEHDRFMETLADIKAVQSKELDELKEQLKQKAQEELNEIIQEVSKEKQSKRRGEVVLQSAGSEERSPLTAGAASTSTSETDDDGGAVNERIPPPRLDKKLLENTPSVDLESPAPVAQSKQDIKTLITEALREVFAGSPFILSSPGQSRDPQTAPGTPAAASAATPLKSMGELRPSSEVPARTPQRASSQSKNRSSVFNLPLSFQEQRSLVDGERQRLQEGRRYVELQQQNLEDRKQQLRRTRHQWKQDVLLAKSEGVRSSSKRGQLLNKARGSLEEQAHALEHDMMVLRDSQLWLLSKEQRLAALEREIDEQERVRNRNGGDVSNVNNWSVDTAALMTGHFKPQRHKSTALDVPYHRDVVMPRGSLGSGSLHLGSFASTPVLSKALNRIERRLDEVTSIIHLQQQQQQQQPTLQESEAPVSRGARRVGNVSSATRDAAQNGGRRSYRSQSKPDVLRRESHLDQWQGPSM